MSMIEQEHKCTTSQDNWCYPQLNPDRDLDTTDRRPWAQRLRDYIEFAVTDPHVEAEDPTICTIY